MTKYNYRNIGQQNSGQWSSRRELALGEDAEGKRSLKKSKKKKSKYFGFVKRVRKNQKKPIFDYRDESLMNCKNKEIPESDLNLKSFTIASELSNSRDSIIHRMNYFHSETCQELYEGLTEVTRSTVLHARPETQGVVESIENPLVAEITYRRIAYLLCPISLTES